ncbi:MAG: LysM peptidoglycan-binding domain-containing protein [Pseudomonadaceae bacterium]|nr:MAG: LysM peptidoglycan-binding domain-containing protein [Pseudomonadaceae bacterium]
MQGQHLQCSLAGIDQQRGSGMAVKRQIITGVASLAALYVGVSNAVGLGELELKSALNQPLNAVIEIPGSQGIQVDDIRVSLASSDAFQLAGVERSHFLTGLRFTPVSEGGQLQIRVQSQQPVREPYLNFLVELRQPNGRILREYTLLLDPPMYDPRTGRVAAATPAPSQRPVATAPAARVEPAAPALPDLSPASDALRYTTQAGDTLWDIASSQRPAPQAGIRQTMLAIRALNPDAFVNGDINRLRQNQELVLPTADQLGVETAVASLADEAIDAEAAEPARTPPRGMEAPTVVEARDPERETESAVAASSEESASLEDRLRIESLPEVASDSDTQGMQQRMAALESRFNVLLSELEDRDRQIAMLQAELEVMRAARDAEEGAAVAGVIAGGQLDGPDQGGPTSPDGTDSPDAGSLSADPLPASETNVVDTTPATSEGGWNAWLWSPLAVLLAFLLGLFIRRRREPQPAEPAVVPVVPSNDEPRMLARPVKPQEAPKASVDPLDGVELYLTYGRFPEARVMLDKAIGEDPERLELRYKQLRVLGELNDAPAFNDLAVETVQLGGDAAAIDQLRTRFPALQQTAAEKNDQVEKIDKLDPLLDEDAFDVAEELDGDSDEGQMNLNDFSLDPDWDLIDALEPESTRKQDNGKTANVEADFDEDFESSLDRLPEVEELDDHEPDAQKQNDNARR